MENNSGKNKDPEFIKEVERLKRDKDVVFYFCFAMQNQHLLELILRRYHFDYPVYVDRAKEFNELNNFPDNMNFRTFLVDKDNRILICGNPVGNEKIKDLYLKMIVNNGNAK